MQKSTRRRSTINYDDEEAYHPLTIKFNRKDGTTANCNILCGLTTKDFFSILGCYFAFYSFLFGFSALLLKGVMETSEKHSLLWSFLIIGILFSIGVLAAILITSRNDMMQKSGNDQQSCSNDGDDELKKDIDVENQEQCIECIERKVDTKK